MGLGVQIALHPYKRQPHLHRLALLGGVGLLVWVAAARDSQRLAELRPQEQRYWRLVSERKGVQDARMLEFRWLLEELRTPQPETIKRQEKAWGQLNN